MLSKTVSDRSTLGTPPWMSLLACLLSHCMAPSSSTIINKIVGDVTGMIWGSRDNGKDISSCYGKIQSCG